MSFPPVKCRPHPPLLGLTLAVSALAAHPLPASAQTSCSLPATASAIAPDLALTTFDSAWSIIHAAHFDTTFNGVDWLALRDELRPRAASAHLDSLRAAIREMLGRLGQSHFSLIPREASPPDDGESSPSSGGEIGAAIRVMDGEAVVLSISADSPAQQVGLSPGWMLRAIDGCAVDDLLETMGDDVLSTRRGRLRARALIERRLDGAIGDTVRLEVVDGRGTTRAMTLGREAPAGDVVRFGNMPAMVADLTVRTIDAVPDADIVVLHFNTWLPVLASRIDAAIEQHRDADGIILDLRGNPGGLGAMVSGVAGHFLDEAHLLGLLRMRASEIRFVANPRRVNARGERVEPLSAPLAIVVDEATGSTSEMFAGALQQVGRARIFGDTTAAQVLPAIAQRLPNGDVLYHAVADFELSDGTRLEGRGVIPDDVVPATRADLLAGRDPALDAAVRWLAAQPRHPD